jgi:hypothetical protein
MKITVRLFGVVGVDDAAENSTIQEVHRFPIEEPIAAGTTFVWREQRYVHYGDIPAGPNEVHLLYVEEQAEVVVE